MRRLTALLAASALTLAPAAEARPLQLHGPASAIVNVNSDATLVAAWTTANAGKTICVAPGTYSYFVQGGSFRNQIVLAGCDSSNPPVFNGIEINGASGVVIRGVKAVTNPSSGRYHNAITVIGSTQVDLDGNELTDVVGCCTPANLGSYNDFDSYLVIENNHIHDSSGGILLSRSDHATGYANIILRSYGNDFFQGSQVQYLTYDHNYEAYPLSDGVTHLDFAQITMANGFSSNLTFTNNTGVRLTSSASNAPQGIPFIGNESNHIFTAAISGGVMTVSACTQCGMSTGDLIEAGTFGIPYGVYITGQTSGTAGQPGTYTLSNASVSMASQTIGSVGYPVLNVIITGNQNYGTQNNGTSCGDCVNATVSGNWVQAYDDGVSTQMNRQGGYNVNFTSNQSTGFQDIAPPQATGTWGNSTPNLSPCHLCGPLPP